MKAGTQHKQFFAALLAVVLVSASLQAATLRVGRDEGADFPTVQDAVAAAVDGDVILIDPGTYVGPGNRDIDLLSKSIHIQSANPLDPAVVAETIIDCGGTPEEPHRGFYVVGCRDATISGLTVTNGLALAGGAVYCKDSSLALVRCRIVANATLPGDERSPDGGPGGGLYCEDSFVSVVQCQIEGNVAGDGAELRGGQGGAGGNGGGVCGVSAEISVENCTIVNNRAGSGGVGEVQGDGGNGGGICASLVTITNGTVSQNAAGNGGNGGRGGGVFAESAVLQKCVIEANQAGTAAGSLDGSGGSGGGVYGDAMEIGNCLVTGNRAGAGIVAPGSGGGLWCSSGTIRNCTIAGNSAFGATADAEVKINASAGAGAGILCTPRTSVVNSILYGNSPDQIAGQDCTNVAYCNIEAGACADGTSNVARDPYFVRSGYWARAGEPDSAAEPQDPEAVWVQGDYRLQTESPCLDAGDPAFMAAADATDLDGNPRVAAAAVDIGAFEFRELTPIYRFWSPVTSKHFYTINKAERDTLIAQYEGIWAYEGIAYYAYARQSDPNLVAVYRFWSPVSGGHFYTADEAERDALIEQFEGIWVFEGTAFYAYAEGRQPPRANAVYRFWSPVSSGHFYTTNEAERDTLIEQFEGIWSFEGVAWYAYVDPNAAEPTTSEPGIFEFSSDQGASCTFTLKAYVDGVEARIDDPELTFGSHLGYMRMVLDFDGLTTTMEEMIVETERADHTTTIRAGAEGQVVIPVTLSTSVFFWAATPRGPYGINPADLTFPLAPAVLAGADETFTLTGSITLDDTKRDIGLAVRATRFDEGQGAFDDSAMPEVLRVNVTEPFQWVRSEREDRLISTTVKENQLQLYITSAQTRMNGVWQGKRSE